MPPHKNFKSYLRLLTLLVAMFSLPVFAFINPTGKNQAPVQIQSDEAQLDSKNAVSVYTGHVRLIQGEVTLLADELTLYHAQGQITKAVAKGKPAIYQSHSKQKPLDARSKTIVYESAKDLITFTQDVEIKQGTDTLRGNRVEYNVTQQTALSKGRTTIVVQPKSKTNTPTS